MVTDASLESDTEANETRWEFSLSSYTYLDQHTRDHVNPNFTADRDWLHLEARYNYEALKTGSVWLGYNLNTGKKPQFEVTPIELTCRALTPLASMAEELIAKGVQFHAVEPRSSVRDRLRHEGVDDKLGGINRFTTVADVIDNFLSNSTSLVS
jgi:hypothetical protein